MLLHDAPDMLLYDVKVLEHLLEGEWKPPQSWEPIVDLLEIRVRLTILACKMNLLVETGQIRQSWSEGWTLDHVSQILIFNSCLFLISRKTFGTHRNMSKTLSDV